MKNIFLILAALFVACGPSELVTEDEPAPEPDPHAETIGFIETKECGWTIGDQACDFQLLDQEENYWRMSDYLGDLTLIDLSAMWCGPCQSAASTTQIIQEQYEKQGFQYVTILIADLQNETVEAEDVDVWVDSFGITTAPVLQGGRDLLQTVTTPHGFPVQSWPTFILVDQSGMVVFGLRGYSQEWLIQEIEANL